MKNIFPLVAAIFCMPQLYAQFNSNSINTSGYYSGGVISINELPVRPPEQLGSIYLLDNWVLGDIHISDEQVLKNIKFKYSIEGQLFEILTGSDRVVVLPGQRVKKFEILSTDRLFINASWVDNERSVGFLESLTEGDIKLFVKHYLVVKEPTYNVAMDVGTKDRRVEKREKLLLMYNENLKEVEGNKKKLSTLFEKQSERALKYIKKNNISSRRTEEVKKLVDYLNSI